MSKDDDSVGYGKPPKHPRWPKGTSGNPKGRPKGARGLKADLQDELKETVTIRMDGRPTTLSKQRLMIKQLANQALKGNVRAIEKLSSLALSLLGPDGESSGDRPPLSADDDEILADYLARQQKSSDHDS